MTSRSESERLARAALSRIVEPDDAVLRRHVANEGVEQSWERLRSGDFRLGGKNVSAAVERAAVTEPRRDLERAALVGVRFICPGEPEWPGILDVLSEHDGGVPFGLWVRGRGDLADMAQRAVAIVGSRAATAYGIRVAADLAAELAGRGWSVVSGGAYGIDSAAHRGALSVGGKTVVVLACGADVVYPAAHAMLFDTACETGVVISESPPGATAMRHRFLSRNRIIAAAAAGTVVVEAAVRSGALNTAGHADKVSRPTMAIPGPVTSRLSAGCHLMLRDRGAVLVTCADDVTELLGPLGDPPGIDPRGAVSTRDELTPGARRALEAVPVFKPASVTHISVTAGLDPRVALARLGELSAQDFVERTAEGWRLSARERASHQGRAAERA